LGQDVYIATVEVQQSVYRLLIYKKANRGRCLKKPLRVLGLKAGDRLEPSGSVPDVAQFERLQPPFWCVFHTGGKHGRVMHKSPLVEIPGVDITAWNVDLLHTWHYGPMSTYISYTILQLLATPLWRSAIAGLEREEADKLALLGLKAELWTFYKHRRETDESWKKKGSEVGTF
jgi:hypothetical protein